MDHTGINKKPWKLKKEIDSLEISNLNNTKKAKEKFITCSVSSFTKPGIPKTYFVENKEFFELRAHVFGYKDDHVRFALLSKACLEWLLELKQSADKWWPDVIHCNDWHTGYFIELARSHPRYQELLRKTPIAYTVHNFYFQGNVNFRYLSPNNRDEGTKPLENLDSPKLIKQNALLRGILSADEVNTVSPTHATEVLTPEYAEGLEKVLTKMRSKLTGILNGLDTKEFNPASDPIIKNNYNTKNYVQKRLKNKLLLQKEFGLSQDAKRPLIAVCGRISTQKGWEIMLETLPKLLEERKDVQLIVMGQGEQQFQNSLMSINKKYPEQTSLHLQTDFRLPRRIYSGADIILLPSLFEPGGIVALEALRYGAVPIIRRTGGLNDIIKDFNIATLEGNGFSFYKKSAWSLYGAIIEALTIYKQEENWKKLVKNCLESDFSWDYAAEEYQKWYQKITEERRRATSSTPHPAYQTIVGGSSSFT